MEKLIIGYCTAEQLARNPELMGRGVKGRVVKLPFMEFQQSPLLQPDGKVFIHYTTERDGNLFGRMGLVAPFHQIELFSYLDQNGEIMGDDPTP